jgi:hypothetical protein
MAGEEKVHRIESGSSYHSIEVEPGLVTPGFLSSQVLHGMLERLRLPASLPGLAGARRRDSIASRPSLEEPIGWWPTP